MDLVRSDSLRADLIREREKYLAWMRRRAFMMFLAGHGYISMCRHQQPAIGGAQPLAEPSVDTAMRAVHTNIASFL